MDTPINELTTGDLLSFAIGLLFGMYMFVDGWRHVTNWYHWCRYPQVRKQRRDRKR